MMIVARAVVAILLIVLTGVYARGAADPERVPDRAPLAAVPMSFGPWIGHEAPPLGEDVVDLLGVDDYINRRYSAEGAAPVLVYVGYYASQRQGDTIHSPQNCLPGAGWRPVFGDRAPVDVGSREIRVNRFLIQKGMDQQAVFYWYQGRGRVVANEFASKGLLMLDAARLRRTDGGLVRLITPVSGSSDAAFASLARFTAALFPHLPRHLP
jgi:EpsI family protein